MSIYNAIANHGRNVGAGLNAFAQGKYQVAQDQRANELQDENRAYVKSRNVLADQRYEQGQQRQATADQLAFGQQTLQLLSSLPPEQRKAAYMARAQEAAQTVGLPQGFNPEEGWARAASQLPPPVDPEAELRRLERIEQIKAGVKAKTPMTPLQEAQLRAANATADSAEIKSQDAESKRQSAAATKSEVSELAQTILDAGDYESVYGAAQGLFPTVRPDIIDAEADVDRLIDLLTLENTSKMTGVLSESDIKILQRAGTKLANKRISNKAARDELQRIAGIFSKASGTLVRDSSGRVVGSQGSDDGWGIVQ